MLRAPCRSIGNIVLHSNPLFGSNQLGFCLYSSTSVVWRGWVPSQQRCGRKQISDVRALRPLVNGQNVAFHVNKLTSFPVVRNINSYGLHVDIRQSGYDSPSESEDTSRTTREYESDLIVLLDMDECLSYEVYRKQSI
jgi:hypothetical protein